ncbi:hypothetical protein [Methylobacterium indicum]|uniref:Uncharacterized protein n=1 Tax=Methylobacterium indicum TaxID=1775910 RepID=A0A8H9CAR2_9HYPH|nr:hypothetical protein [Methylobacterium indicum]BCM87710.1 hypothetical protein mvi_61710 [Methylobacterium indicum]
MWSVVNFGKWKEKGKTLPQIIVSDPDWFFWAMETDSFLGSLKAEAAMLARRAQSIRLPAPYGSDHCIQYMITTDRKIADFNIIPSNRPAHLGSSSEIRRAYLSLRMPREINEYDKLGGRQIIRIFKYHWFNNKNLTKKAVETFFDTASHFEKP